MATTLLVDTDIIAYKDALRAQDNTGFGLALWDFSDACARADSCIEDLVKLLKADRVILCLSDEEANFRKAVLPTYKEARKDTQRPEYLYQLKQYLADEYESKGYPGLEADDVMGILSTHQHAIPGKKIIVSEDKDMRTIPGLLYAPHRPELGVMHITELQADQFHMWQTIAGDPTDGYKGVPGLGKDSIYAEAVLTEDWGELWDTVLLAYGSKGLSETEALAQARCARILRSCDYNIQTKELLLWEPPLLLNET
jgi:DNA polymerase-1